MAIVDCEATSLGYLIVNHLVGLVAHIRQCFHQIEVLIFLRTARATSSPTEFFITQNQTKLKSLLPNSPFFLLIKKSVLVDIAS